MLLDTSSVHPLVQAVIKVQWPCGVFFQATSSASEGSCWDLFRWKKKTSSADEFCPVWYAMMDFRLCMKEEEESRVMVWYDNDGRCATYI